MSEGIAVTGLGMISALGRDVVTSCAAARAGLSRLADLEEPLVQAPDADEPEPVKGHSAAGYTDGYAGLGRLARLGAAALTDLASYTGLSDWDGTGLLLNLPSGFYPPAAARRAAAPEPGSIEEALEEAEGMRRMLQQKLAGTVVKLARVPIPPALQRVHFGDQSGFVDLLWTACQALANKQLERCIVGGIDSYVEADLLEALYATGILKTGKNPAGMVPGEGAALLLLEPIRAAQARGARIEATIGGLSRNAEPFDRFAEDVAVGAALAGSMAATVIGLSDGGPRSPRFVIGSMNGDSYRARDWGYACVRLKARDVLGECTEWHPALHFGEIGAATGAAAACLATRAFARAYAPDDAAVVWLASDDGGRGSFFVRRADA